MNKKWNTTVNELVYILHGALTSLLPWLGKANIYTCQEGNYDAFDNICNALYENIICSALVGEVNKTYKMPRYGIHYQSYTGFDFINVITESKSNKLAFIEFVEGDPCFQSVKVAVLDEKYNVIEYIALKYEGLRFSYCKFEEGYCREIQDISLSL